MESEEQIFWSKFGQKSAIVLDCIANNFCFSTLTLKAFRLAGSQFILNLLIFVESNAEIALKLFCKELSNKEL